MKTVPYDVTTASHSRARFVPGTVFGPDASGSVYMYVKVSGAGALAGNFAYPSNLIYGSVTVTPTRTSDNPVGVFVNAVGDGKYGFIKVKGTAQFASASGTLSAGTVVQGSGSSSRIAAATAGAVVVGRLLTNADYGTPGTVLLDIEPTLAREP